MSLLLTSRAMKHAIFREFEVPICFLATKTRGGSNAGTGKNKNYYDTLEISQTATQNEIKSAYYKLTMRYHPDRNRTNVAKEKFQDVAEAYAVLGNHDLRRNYDRRMSIRSGNTSCARRHDESSKSPSDSRSTVRNPERAETRTTHMYDIDKWTRAHYGYAFDHARKRKDINERFKETGNVREYARHKNQINLLKLILLCSLIVVSLLLCLFGLSAKFLLSIEIDSKEDG